MRVLFPKKKVCRIYTMKFKQIIRHTVINSLSLEDTQVGYISQKYTLDKYTFKTLQELRNWSGGWVGRSGVSGKYVG